ncbi:hypothetical protein PAMP_011029 [Pampus punctatissimus]
MKLLQCGQGSTKGRQPRSGALESKQSRFCPRLPPAHPSLPQQLWSQPSRTTVLPHLPSSCANR